MRKTVTIIIFFASLTAARGIPVYDGARHVTDLIDNIQDIIDQVSQIKNQVEQINNQVEQIKQMNDYLDRVGHAARVGVKIENLVTNDLKEILEEINEYTGGAGLTESEKKENSELYGGIDKQSHTAINVPEPEKKYEKHERVEKEYAAYKQASESISLKRMQLLDELQRLSGLLDTAETDQEVQKIGSSINAHKLMLAGLKDEEERQYRSFLAEIRRNENVLAKEITRFQERTRFNDIVNSTRKAVYTLRKSRDILKLIENGNQ